MTRWAVCGGRLVEAQSDRSEWAKTLTLEAFRECGVRLSENDSLLLVAAVFRKALDAWAVEERRALEDQLVSIGNAGNDLATGLRTVIAAEFGAQSTRLRTALLADAESASATANDAVRKALLVPGQNVWKFRAEGAFAGSGLMVLGAMLYHWLR